jgi:hypothetical protein
MALTTKDTGNKLVPLTEKKHLKNLLKYQQPGYLKALRYF